MPFYLPTLGSYILLINSEAENYTLSPSEAFKIHFVWLTLMKNSIRLSDRKFKSQNGL